MDSESRYESAEEVQFSLGSLPNLIEKVIQEQHQDLLMQLDSRLESFGRRMEKEKSFSAVRSGSKLSRLHSQSSKLSRLSRAFTKEDPFAALQMASSSPNLPQRKLGFDPPEVDDKTALDSGGSLPVSRKESDPKSESSDLGMLQVISLQPKVDSTLSRSPAESGQNVGHIDSEAGLNSYDLAHRQGSRVDHFKKQMMMSSSDVVGSGSLDEPTYCSEFQRRCAMVVKSNSCDLLFALMIFSNSVYLGVQLEMTSTNPHRIESQQETFFAVNMVYAVVFLLEVLLRLVASGVTPYFCAPGWGWNWLDVFVVTSTWIELLFSLFELEGANGLSNSNLRLFRLVKITRLARVLRVLRVVQYVRPLRTLMHCLVDTTKSFVWAMLLLVLMMYVFGLLFTDACLDYLREGNANDPLSPQKHFGSVSASMGTLFRSISNGLDWSEAVDTLLPVGDIWIWLFYLYIAFNSFAVLNVMTGVFCDSAIKAAERDHEMVIHSLLQTKKDFKELVSNLFFRIDDLGLGMITIAEFEKHFNDEAVRAFFESLEMGAADAWTLFASLDADGDNVISLKDFTERCIQLHGPARSVDLFALAQQNAKLRDQLKHIEEMQYSLARYVKRKAQDALQKEMDSQDPGTHCLV